MTRIMLAGFAALALGATALVLPAAAQSKCAMYGGEATMVTEDLAKFMANAALKNSISGAKAKTSGAVKMDCKAATLSTYCKATQKACK